VANFFKNREKPDENSRKYLTSNRLHFSREREKGLKKGWEFQAILLLKNRGTGYKKRAKRPLFNGFAVPQNAWDKPGTRLGHGTA